MRIKTIAFTLIIFLGALQLCAKNHALLIGIGDYNSQTTGWGILHGNNDVALLESKLKSKGFNVKKLVDRKATKRNIISALENLVSTSASGDVVYLHFSGHGQLIQDMNGDENGDFDQSFVCYDACFSPNYKVAGQSYRGQNHLIDDELFPYLDRLKRKVSIGGQVVVIFDTCYSEGADRGGTDDNPNPDSEVEWTTTTRGTDYEFQVNKSAETYLCTIKRPGNYSNGGGAITIISACESDKRNYECKAKHSGKKYGSLSYCISKMLDSNVPMSQWSDYFISRKYKPLKIFRASQHPIAETH